MTELPAGWKRSTVGQIGEYINGRGFKKTEWAESGRPIIRIQNLTGSGSGFNHFEGPLEERYVVPPGALLVSWAATLGVYRWDGPEGALNQHIFRVRSFIDEDFHRYLLEHALDLMQEHTHGSGMVHITRGRFDSTPVPVPPLAEQERIVAGIDEAYSKLDAGEAGLRTVRQLLKRTREAVLAAAVTGRLVPQDPTDTPATRLLADLGVEPLDSDRLPGLPEGWVHVRVADIAKVGSGTTPKRGRGDYWAAGSIPWVTSGALNAGIVREASEYVTEAALRETSLRVWPPGTLLVAMYGEGKTRGRCAELSIAATCNQACAAIALRDGLQPYRQTLRLHFDANYSTNRGLAAGGVQPNLSGTLIKEMIVALPPVEEALRIVAEVERQMSFIETCERSVEAGLAVSAALRRSVLKAAFEGRLVPQDPTDEPASALLERMRTERAATPNPKKRARATA